MSPRTLAAVMWFPRGPKVKSVHLMFLLSDWVITQI